MHASARIGLVGLLSVLLGTVAVGTTACDEEVSQEFRSAASEDLASGIKTILDAIVDGIFAVVQPDEASSGSSSSSSSSSGGSTSGSSSSSG